MAKCRSMFALVLVSLWTAIPALACLPNATMTQAEMACCKKMAGDCHMSAGRHPCCKTTVERASAVALFDRPATEINPVASILMDVSLPEPRTERIGSRGLEGLSPPAPPGLNPILRI